MGEIEGLFALVLDKAYYKNYHKDNWCYNTYHYSSYMIFRGACNINYK